MLDIFFLGTCRWSELFIYFGSFAFWALKFKFFDGRLTANKRLPITDSCQKIYKNVVEKARRINIHLQKQKETTLKQETKKKKEKAKGN